MNCIIQNRILIVKQLLSVILKNIAQWSKEEWSNIWEQHAALVQTKEFMIVEFVILLDALWPNSEAIYLPYLDSGWEGYVKQSLLKNQPEYGLN